VDSLAMVRIQQFFVVRIHPSSLGSPTMVRCKDMACPVTLWISRINPLNEVAQTTLWIRHVVSDVRIRHVQM
jgi:hypothetical protein